MGARILLMIAICAVIAVAVTVMIALAIAWWAFMQLIPPDDD